MHVVKCRQGEEEEEAAFPVAMAQHLLHAADKYDCPRLQSLCEQRLVEAL